MSSSTLRIRQAASLVRDWVLPGEAIAQWTHFVTSKCNAKCKHCFYPINQRKNELTLDEIDRFLKTMPRIRLLLFSGGEPFLRRDLPEIIKSYHDHCGFFTASVPTNGFDATHIGSMIRRICAISPDIHFGVAVSLDGMQEFHDRVRQVPGLWTNALATLRILIGMTREFPNLTVGVNTVFMRENQNEIEPLFDLIYNDYRPTFHALSFIRGNPVDPTLALDLDVDRYLQLSRWLDEHYSAEADGRKGSRGVRTRTRFAINRMRYDYIARQARGGTFEAFCLAGEREYVMSETGDIYGCELLSDKLGSIRESNYDFGTIRDGDATAAFASAKRERKCKCTHECNTRTMILFDRSKVIPILAQAIGLRKS